MASSVARMGRSGRIDPRDIDALRDEVATMMVTVQQSAWASWSDGSYSFDADDVRWLEARLAAVAAEYMGPSWPSPDIAHSSSVRWYWELYSPDLLRQASRKDYSGRDSRLSKPRRFELSAAWQHPRSPQYLAGSFRWSVGDSTGLGSLPHSVVGLCPKQG